MLLVVRHAMPDYSAEVPSDRWELGEDGRCAARRLGPVLPSGALLVASAEPRAWQTLESLGPVTRDRRFNEVGRVEPWEGDYLRLRRDYVNGADHRGWEPRDQVAARFGAAVSDHLSAADGRPLVGQPYYPLAIVATRFFRQSVLQRAPTAPIAGHWVRPI